MNEREKRELRLVLLKEIEKGNFELNYNGFNATKEDVNDEIKYLSSQGYITGTTRVNEDTLYLQATLTSKGKDLLK